jgi:uncharacterized protein DUF5676
MTAVGTSLRGQAASQTRINRTIPVIAFGLSLSLFFVISYVICVIGYLLFPSLPINHAALEIFLPGFQLLTWASFCIGLIESFAYGWYIALIFGPLYNFFVTR